MSLLDGEGMPMWEEDAEESAVLASRRSLWTGLWQISQVWFSQLSKDLS